MKSRTNFLDDLVISYNFIVLEYFRGTLPKMGIFSFALTIIVLLIQCQSKADLKGQYFPNQHGRLKSRITSELPKVSGIFCDTKSAPLE